MEAPTEPNAEASARSEIPADPFAPTEPNAEAQVPSTTADVATPTEPNAEAEVTGTTAETAAPTEPNIPEVGLVGWPAAQGHVQLELPAPTPVEDSVRDIPSAKTIAPTEPDAEAQVPSGTAVVFAPTEPNAPDIGPAKSAEGAAPTLRQDRGSGSLVSKDRRRRTRRSW